MKLHNDHKFVHGEQGGETVKHQTRSSGGWTWFAKHDGAIDRFELSCNEPSYCADLEELKQIQLQELEVTKMEVSPILVV